MFTFSDQMKWARSMYGKLQRRFKCSTPIIPVISMCVALVVAMIVSRRTGSSPEPIDFTKRPEYEMLVEAWGEPIEVTKLPEFKAHFETYVASFESAIDSVQNKVKIPENPFFVRTIAVQKLYEYLEARSRALHSDLYAADPDYRHIRCRQSEYVDTVREFVKSGGMYNEELLASITKKVAVDESLQKGLPAWPGHNGLIATEDIASDICIGHYHGDEYLEIEFN